MTKLILLACVVVAVRAGNLLAPALPSAEIRYAAPAPLLRSAPVAYAQPASIAYAQPARLAYAQPAPFAFAQQGPIFRSSPALVQSAPILRSGPTLIHQAAPIVKAGPIIAKAEEYDPNPQYSFGYDIHDSLTGDVKSQSETRNGDSVQGSYALNEPDGTRRIVDYSADPINGFNAVVRKEPIAEHAIIKAAPIAAAPIAYGASPIVKTTTYVH